MPFSYIEQEQVHFVKQDRISGYVTLQIFILFTISKENANMCSIDLHVWGLLSQLIVVIKQRHFRPILLWF